MEEPKLALCRCGGKAVFLTNDRGSAYAQCTRCKIQTQAIAASIEYGAKERVADIWNAGAEMWPRWVRPAVPADGYDTGAQVSHTTGAGGAWEHWVSHFTDGKNIHEPGVSGWTLVGPAPAE